MFKIVGIAQIDSVAGDFEYNAKKIIKYIKNARKVGTEVLVFPKNALCGNLMEDVLKRYPYLESECEKWLHGIAQHSENILIFLGYINNSFAVIENGKICEIIKNVPFVYKNICITEYEMQKSDLIINIKQTTGKDVLLMHNALSYLAKEKSVPIIYVNSVGATDNISYIGSGAVFNCNGEKIACAKAFEEELLIVNNFQKGSISQLPISLNSEEEFSLNYEDDLERTYLTLIQGIKGYFNKCGIKRAVLGLSGGLDSTVCAVLLANALGKENVLGISMPSEITSDESKSDAQQLAENLGINFTQAPIKSMVSCVGECFESLFNNVQPFWNDRYGKSFTKDNIQARLRAMYLFGVSNEFPSCIPIATSDKSESYMGYATINGDMSGGFAPIADVTKTKLFALARWINKNIADVIPQNVINKRPGAELAINPKTGKPLQAEEALMPYEFLDEIIWRIEIKNQSYSEMLDIEFLYEKSNSVSKEQKVEWLDKFFKRVSSALYKWSITPPGIVTDKITINKFAYSQPITSCRIDYKGKTQTEIFKICKEISD